MVRRTVTKMSSVLKLIILNVIILIVLIVSVVVSLRNNKSEPARSPQGLFHTVTRETVFRDRLVTSTSSMSSSSPKNPIAVVELLNDGIYFDFSVEPVAIVDFDTLEKVGRNYYKSTSTVYYLKNVSNPCENTNENKLVVLPVEDIASFKVDTTEGDVAKDSKNVFIDFYQVAYADPSSFSYVGMSKSKEVLTDTTSYFWYKDAKKIYSIVKVATVCKGESILEDVNNETFKNVDSATFEYLGAKEEDVSKGYAKDRNFFYSSQGILSKSVLPSTCMGDFFEECLPAIMGATSSKAMQ